ncbi:hypothetical protein ABT160_23005 [Streptomyces sp. NPDC001941]|uniref:hypothetical protein n=1 Tax=Streptomyces sp. NPDC001941 TaxID=3154659 RepID=UPI00332033AC
MRRLPLDLVIAVAVGLGTAWCVSAGDAAGGTWGHFVSEPVWPWFVLVAALGATSGSLMSAVLRSTVSMLIMLYCYYRDRDDLESLADPGNWAVESSPFYWLVAALTVVPLVASASYGIRSAVRRGLLTRGR